MFPRYSAQGSIRPTTSPFQKHAGYLQHNGFGVALEHCCSALTWLRGGQVPQCHIVICIERVEKLLTQGARARPSGRVGSSLMAQDYEWDRRCSRLRVRPAGGRGLLVSVATICSAIPRARMISAPKMGTVCHSSENTSIIANTRTPSESPTKNSSNETAYVTKCCPGLLHDSLQS